MHLIFSYLFQWVECRGPQSRRLRQRRCRPRQCPMNSDIQVAPSDQQGMPRQRTRPSWPPPNHPEFPEVRMKEKLIEILFAVSFVRKESLYFHTCFYFPKLPLTLRSFRNHTRTHTCIHTLLNTIILDMKASVLVRYCYYKIDE